MSRLQRRVQDAVRSWQPVARARLRVASRIAPRRAENIGVGRVRFGDLRRLTPVSERWGFDRGTPVDRYYVEGFLARHAADIRGRVLEIGDASYTRRFGGAAVRRSDVLDIDAQNPRATLVADLETAEEVGSATFDCAIFTQTLHFIYDFRAALRTLHRILKPGGVLLATFPGITRIGAEHDWGGMYHWSFTRVSAGRFLDETFGSGNTRIDVYGNVLTAVAFLHGVAAEELHNEELMYRDVRYEVLISARAVKRT